jgi:hypothetical protein
MTLLGIDLDDGDDEFSDLEFEEVESIAALDDSVAEEIYNWNMEQEGWSNYKPYEKLPQDVKDDFLDIAHRVLSVIEDTELEIEI